MGGLRVWAQVLLGLVVSLVAVCSLGGGLLGLGSRKNSLCMDLPA